MDRKEFDAWEARVLARARMLWTEAGEPEGGPEHYRDAARELVAIEESPKAATHPVKDGAPDGEPMIAIENQGEFPTLTDQGEEPIFPGRGPDWPESKDGQ